MTLEALNHRLLELFWVDGLLGDFAQRDHRVLVVVPINGKRGARRNIPCTLGSRHDEIESIGYSEDAILNGNAGHSGPPKV